MRLTNRARAAALLLSLVSGCAAIQANRARTAYLKTQLGAYRYAQPIDDVWQQGRKLLSDRGFGLAGKDAEAVGQKENFFRALLSPARETRANGTGGQFLETGWNGDRQRFRMEALADEKGFRVEFTRFDEDPSRTGGVIREHDTEMDLDLVRRVDPVAAARIQEGMDLAAAGKPAPDVAATPVAVGEAGTAGAGMGMGAATAAAPGAAAVAAGAAPAPDSAAPASPPSATAALAELTAVGEAFRHAIAKRDLASILARVPDAGYACGDRKVSKLDVAAALGTPGTFANAYLFDGAAFHAKYRSAARPWSVAEVLADPGGAAVSVDVPSAPRAGEAAAPACVVYKVVNGGERASLCFQRAGTDWLLDAGLMGCP
jgi:hypothetical protein